MAYESFFGFAGTPTLTPPLKGEGDTGVSESPSPLRGGVRGGGSNQGLTIHMR